MQQRMRKLNMCHLFISLSVLILMFLSTLFSQAAEINDMQHNRLETLLFTPQKSMLVGSSSIKGSKGSIGLWSLDDGKLRQIISLRDGEWAKLISVSHEGTLLAVVSVRIDRRNSKVSREIGCYSLQKKDWLWREQIGHKRLDSQLLFTPDDHSIVFLAFDTIVTYDARTGKVLKQIQDSHGFSGGFPAYKTRFAALSPSTGYAVMWQGNLEHDETLSWNPNVWVVVWDLGKKQIVGRQEKMQAKYKNCSAVFTPDENHVFLGSMDGCIRDWSIPDQTVVKEWKAYGVGLTPPSEKQYTAPANIDLLMFSADGRYLAIIGFELRKGFVVRIFDHTSYDLLSEFIDVASIKAMCSGYPMAFSQDSKYFALEKKGNICLYDTASWQEKWCVQSGTDDSTKVVAIPK